MKRKHWIYLFLGVVLVAIACGLTQKMTSTPEKAREALSTPEGAQHTATIPGNDAYLATVSAKGTARAQELSVQLTKLSFEPKAASSEGDSSSWITRWLTHPACQPPCWENITPGETPIDEAAKIVYQIPEAGITWLPAMAEATEGGKNLQWSLSQSGFGWIGTESGQEIVSVIHLGVGGEQKLLLGDVIAAYGNPSSVVKGLCHGSMMNGTTCVYSIVFKDRGMELDIGIHNNKTIEIQADTEISTIFLYPLSEPRLNEPGLVWSGYGPYDFTNY